MERSGIREQAIHLPLVSPDFATLHPGYGKSRFVAWMERSEIREQE